MLDNTMSRAGVAGADDVQWPLGAGSVASTPYPVPVDPRLDELDQPDAGADQLVVWKFGGTSVADPGRLRAVADRMVAAHRSGRRVVAVLSAMGSSTDRLHELAYGISPRPRLRELDALLSVGECISCALAAMAVHELGENAVSLTGPQAGMITDDSHGGARLREIRPHRITAALDEGAIVLVTGYQGLSPAGDVTTLGRGGSDASAVAVAAALGLHECEIFTDVAGVYTADPRVVPGARLLHTLGRQEMLQLATGGAGVLQPRAVELAAAHDIDIHVRSSFTADAGTWILKEKPMFESTEITGVAHHERETLYTMREMSPAMISAVLAQRGAAFGAIIRQGRAVSFTVPGVDETEVAAAFQMSGARVTMQRALGTVSVVSTGINRRPEVTARALGALADAGVEPELVTSTPSRISFHVPAAKVRHAVRRLHQEFGLHSRRAPAPVRAVS